MAPGTSSTSEVPGKAQRSVPNLSSTVGPSACRVDGNPCDISRREEVRAGKNRRRPEETSYQSQMPVGAVYDRAHFVNWKARG